MFTHHGGGWEGQSSMRANRKWHLRSFFGNVFCFLGKSDGSVPGASEFKERQSILGASENLVNNFYSSHRVS